MCTQVRWVEKTLIVFCAKRSVCGAGRKVHFLSLVNTIPTMSWKFDAAINSIFSFFDFVGARRWLCIPGDMGNSRAVAVCGKGLAE